MSVCRKLPDGTIQKIAGHTILLDANASEIREGIINIPALSAGASTTITVTFTDPMPDTDYMVVFDNTTGGSSVSANFSDMQRTVTGFICNVQNVDNSTAHSAGTVHYHAYKPVKIEGYTALQNKVNSPDATPTIDSMNLVTSGGVYEAIKNASAVWKGTKAAWEALPAAEKQTYDLAVLLDKTLVKAVDREDGTETDVANLNKIFRGTEAEWQALSAAEKDAYDEAITTGEQNPVAWPFPKPDWANATTKITIPSNGYVCPNDGIIISSIRNDSQNAYHYCNGVTINAATGAGITFVNTVPVSKGDVITESVASNESSVQFVPWKQA